MSGANDKKPGAWCNAGALWEAFPNSAYVMNGELNVGELLVACLNAAAKGETKLKVFIYEAERTGNLKAPTHRIRVPMPSNAGDEE